MKCPFCAHMENKVIDSRLSKDGEVIRRRRECDNCVRRFTSYEHIEQVMPQVIKADGRREPFERGKMMRGIVFACEKRPLEASRVERLVDDIEQELQDTGEREIDSSVIIDAVLSRLGTLDDIAYARYAARYGRFKDLQGFAEELNAVIAGRTGGGDGGV